MDESAETGGDTLRDWLIVYLKGVCMGIADMIPGVSGGTIALIVGIYDRLVNAVAALDPTIVGHITRLHTASGRERLIEDLLAMDVPFLGILGAGVMTAVVVLSRVILWLFQTFPAEVNAFFFGLIGGSAMLMYRDVTFDTVPRLFAGLLGFSIAFTVSGVSSDGIPHGLLVVFFAGAIAISAMILPGISGAAILYIMGQYEFMLTALRTVIDGITTILTGDIPSDSLEAAIVVGTFMTGALVGVITTARIVAWAFARFRIETIVFLVSLMVGALRLPVEQIYDVTGTPDVTHAGILVIIAVGGVLAVYVLNRATGTLSYT